MKDIPRKDEEQFVAAFNAAVAARLPVPKIDVGGCWRVYSLGRWLFSVFDDCGEWDYIEWVLSSEGPRVWGYNDLTERVRNLLPDEGALETVFRWSAGSEYKL